MVTSRIWDIWSRAETGPIITDKDFYLKRYWKRVKELVKEIDLRFDPNNIVPTDDGLIDSIYQAGLRLLLDVGVFCINTNKVIEFGEKEVKTILRDLPGKGSVGSGKDEAIYEHHDFEDNRYPVVLGGLCGAPMSENIAIKTYESFAKEPIIDVIYLGLPTSIEGITIKPNSPYELHAEIANIAWARTAIRKMGRPDMCIYGSAFPGIASNIASSSQEWGYRKTDLRCVWLLPTLKVDYESLIRAVHYTEYGCPIHSAGAGYIGGSTGGPETSVLSAVAEDLAATIMFQPLTNETIVFNTYYEPLVASTEIKAIWGQMHAGAAVSSKTKTIVTYGCYTFAGPSTEMCLQEIAAEAIAGASIGLHPYACTPNSGLMADHVTGMENRVKGEIARSAAGIKRSEANELVKQINKLYQDKIEKKTTPPGQSIQECYDLNTVTPSKQYLDIYEKLKNDLKNSGFEIIY